MATTLTVDLKNNTAQGLGAIRSDLSKAAGAADEFAKSADAAGEALPTNEADALASAVRELTAQMEIANNEGEKQVRVINEQRSSWSHLAATAIPAITAITTTSIKYAGTLAALAARQKALETIVAPLASSQRALNFAWNAGEKAAVRGAASLAGYGAAASSVISVVGAVTLAWKGLEAALAHTGATAKGTVLAFDGTDEQVDAYFKLAESAKAAGVDIETAMAAANKSMEDFGVQNWPVIETNLDRVRDASSRFGERMSALASETGKALAGNVQWLASYSAEWQFVEANVKRVQIVWKEFDRELTKGTENYSTNLLKLGDLITGLEASVSEASAKVSRAQAASVDDFARVRISEKDAEAASRSRAEAARLAGLSTTQAVDSEIQKLKEQRGIMAANDQFTEKAAQKYLSDLERLESRRSSLLDKRKQEEAAERADRIAKEKTANDTITRQYNDAFEARNKAILKENADYEKALDDEVRAIMDKSKEEQRLAREVTAEHEREFQRRRDAYVASWKAAVDSAAALVSGDKGGGPNIVDQMRSRLDPRAIAKNIGDQRADEAVSKFRESGEGKRREDALVARGFDRSDAERKVMVQQKAIAEQARARGFRDSMQGNASESEKINAERDLIGNSLKQAAEQGGLNQQLLQGFQQAANQAFQNAQEIASQRQQLQVLMASFGDSAARTRAQRGSR